METIDWTDPRYSIHKETFDLAVEDCYRDLKAKDSLLTNEQLKEFAQDVMESLFLRMIQDFENNVPIV